MLNAKNIKVESTILKRFYLSAKLGAPKLNLRNFALFAMTKKIC